MLFSICLLLFKQKIVFFVQSHQSFIVLRSALSFYKIIKVLVLFCVILGRFESYSSEEIRCDRVLEQHGTASVTLQGFRQIKSLYGFQKRHFMRPSYRGLSRFVFLLRKDLAAFEVSSRLTIRVGRNTARAEL